MGMKAGEGESRNVRKEKARKRGWKEALWSE